MRVRLRVGGPIAATVLLLAALPLPASAGAKAFDSKVSLEEYDSPSFIGDVSSQKRGCERRRKVVLFLEGKFEDQRYGTDTTDRRGDFEITPPGTLLNQNYYVVAPRKGLGSGDSCKKKRSNDLYVESDLPPLP